MKYLKSLLIFIAFPAVLFAQSNYKPGYVVTSKGDTVKGFIDYREWDETPLNFSFKQLQTSNKITKYSPSDVRYVNIDNLESFMTYTGRITMDAVDPNNVRSDNDRDTSTKVVTVFFKVLEKGDRLALYGYKDDVKQRFFIGDAPGFQPQELVFKVTRTTTENTFQKQLNAFALKYNELTATNGTFISRSEYSEDNILKIVSRINHIGKTEYNKTHYSGPIFNLFIGAGVNINTTSPDNSGPYYEAGGRSYTSYGPQGSVGINLFANPATRKLQFRIEVGGAGVNYKSLYMSKALPYVPTEVTYNELALSVSPQIIYNFYNTDNFRVFAGVGFVLYHFSYSNAYFGSQNHDGSVDYVAANDPFLFETGDNAFVLKAGVQFTKNLAISGSYQSTVNNTNGGYFKLSSGTAQIGLTYLFEIGK